MLSVENHRTPFPEESIQLGFMTVESFNGNTHNGRRIALMPQTDSIQLLTEASLAIDKPLQLIVERYDTEQPRIFCGLNLANEDWFQTCLWLDNQEDNQWKVGFSGSPNLYPHVDRLKKQTRKGSLIMYDLGAPYHGSLLLTQYGLGLHVLPPESQTGIHLVITYKELITSMYEKLDKLMNRLLLDPTSPYLLIGDPSLDNSSYPLEPPIQVMTKPIENVVKEINSASQTIYDMIYANIRFYLH